MLNVIQMAAVLGISCVGAYELVRSEEFPALKIGNRIVVPKDKLRTWIDANTGTKTKRSMGVSWSRSIRVSVKRYVEVA